jgi:hypothetical protein
MRNPRFVSPSYTTIFIKGFAPILILLGMLTVLKPEASARLLPTNGASLRYLPLCATRTDAVWQEV